MPCDTSARISRRTVVTGLVRAAAESSSSGYDRPAPDAASGAAIQEQAARPAARNRLAPFVDIGGRSSSSQTTSTPRLRKSSMSIQGLICRAAMHHDMRPVGRIDRDIVGGKFGSGDVMQVGAGFRAPFARQRLGDGAAGKFGRLRTRAPMLVVDIRSRYRSQARAGTGTRRRWRRRAAAAHRSTGPNHRIAASGRNDQSG